MTEGIHHDLIKLPPDRRAIRVESVSSLVHPRVESSQSHDYSDSE